MSHTRLPPHFTSLYRLHLRATSAAVLHQGPATRGLRRLFRPAFEVASRNIRRLQNLNQDNVKERKELESWLKVFEKRMDNNLSLLHNSAISRGLPHRLTSNLSFLTASNHSWSTQRFLKPIGSWNPRLPPDSPEYKVKPEISQRIRNKSEKVGHMQDVDDRGWGALGEAIRMAEGRDGLVLSKVRFDKRGAML